MKLMLTEGKEFSVILVKTDRGRTKICNFLLYYNSAAYFGDMLLLNTWMSEYGFCTGIRV
jgi:hypothetical protein